MQHYLGARRLAAAAAAAGETNANAQAQSSSNSRAAKEQLSAESGSTAVFEKYHTPTVGSGEQNVAVGMPHTNQLEELKGLGEGG